jgi:hypothetical protein
MDAGWHRRMTPANWIAMVLMVGMAPLMLVSFLVYRALVTNFVPSSKLSWLSLSLAAAVFATVLAIGVSANHRRISNYFSAGDPDGLKALAVTLFGPLMLACLPILFVGGPLSYAMHLGDSPRPSHVSIPIERVFHGSRRCRLGERLILQGSSFLFPRSICDRSGSTSGTRVELYGYESSYGFVYQRAERK